MSIREHLELLTHLKAYALEKGDFTLKSGKKSNFLIDCKKVVLTAKGHQLVGPIMYAHIIEALPTAVAGVELGGCPLASAVSMYSASTSCPMDAIYVRKEKKEHGSKSLLDGASRLAKGASVIVLEDVTTTGSSSLFAVQQLWKYGFNVLGICTLVDREEGGREAIEKEKLRFWSVYNRKDLLE